MWSDKLDGSQHNLKFDLPYVNASGILGYSPHIKQSQLLGNLGAFITNPISYNPRKVAANRAFIKFQGGFLLHTGYPNLGFFKTVKKYKDQWEKASIPIIVHLLPEETTSLLEMVQVLETIENIAAIELSFPRNLAISQINRLVKAATGELPLILSLDHEQALIIEALDEGINDFIARLAEPYGVLPLDDGSLIQGRIYGPAVFPAALSGVQRLSGLGLRVIGGGGVYTQQQAEAMFNAGAEVVSFDTLLWNGGIDLEKVFGGHSIG